MIISHLGVSPRQRWFVNVRAERGGLQTGTLKPASVERLRGRTSRLCAEEGFISALPSSINLLVIKSSCCCSCEQLTEAEGGWELQPPPPPPPAGQIPTAAHKYQIMQTNCDQRVTFISSNFSFHSSPESHDAASTNLLNRRQFNVWTKSQSCL